MTVSTDTSVLAFPERYFAAWNAGDAAAVLALLAPSFRWTDPSLPGPLDSIEGAQAWVEGSCAALPDIAFEAIGEPMLDAGGRRVAQEWRMTGSHTGADFPPGNPASGNSFDVTGTDVFTVDYEGRATVIAAYYDAATLGAQLAG